MSALIFVTTPPSRKATTTNTQIPVAQEKADAANDAAAADANDLNVSMNRGERLKAIEQRIAKLKSDADTKAASALSAASEAQDVRDSLDALRVQGENRRAELESKQDQLQSDAAKQAVQTVLLQSKIDDANRDSTHSNRRMRLAAPIPVSPHFGNELGRSVSNALESVGE